MRIRLNLPVGMTIVLFDEQRERREMMEAQLSASGYKVAPPVGRCADLADAGARYRPNALVVRTASPRPELFAALADRPDDCACPVVLFSEDDSPQSMERAIQAGVNAYVVTGLSGNRIRSAIDLAVANFAQTEALRSEAAAARQALDDRKIIERAKGILMKQRNLDEPSAYRLLRERAMSRAERLVEVARAINDAAEVLVGDPADASRGPSPAHEAAVDEAGRKLRRSSADGRSANPADRPMAAATSIRWVDDGSDTCTPGSAVRGGNAQSWRTQP